MHWEIGSIPELVDEQGNFWVTAEPEYWAQRRLPFTRRVIQQVVPKLRFKFLLIWRRIPKWRESFFAFEGYEEYVPQKHSPKVVKLLSK